MAAHVRLKDDFTEDEKCHYLVSRLISVSYVNIFIKKGLQKPLYILQTKQAIVPGASVAFAPTFLRSVCVCVCVCVCERERERERERETERERNKLPAGILVIAEALALG